jgi:hypothetical protein
MEPISDLLSHAASDLRRGWSVSLGELAIAALVMLPFTFALTLLVNAMAWWPSAAMVVLAGLVQGVGMFWNAGWRARTAMPGDGG